MWAPNVVVAFAVVAALLPQGAPKQFYGCELDADLCEENEYCFLDGVFGQCYDPESGDREPKKLTYLNEAQLELLRLEVQRLARADHEWSDDITQCTLAYYKLSMYYELRYSPEYCRVRNPALIWDFIKDIEAKLDARENGSYEEDQLLPLHNAIDEIADLSEKNAVAKDVVPLTPDPDEYDISTEEALMQFLQHLRKPEEPPEYLQNRPTDPLVDKYIEDVVRGINPDLSLLTDQQLNQLITRLFILKANLIANAVEHGEAPEDGEEEQAIPLDEAALANQQLVLKKDVEKVGNVNLGLENTEHKIVKGRNAGIARVVGNRVYLKLKLKNDEQLYPIIEYLENTLAYPNNLIFDDFQFNKGQLSMRISRFDDTKPKKAKRINSVEGVASAVYKRRKDIARFSGAEVAETGIGIGDESVPVESSERDWIIMPVLFICAFTVAALMSVLAVQYYRNRRNYHRNIRQMAEDLEGKSSLAYQELCRQRVCQEGSPVTGVRSKSSSTSSWCGDESEKPAIDISTGHVVLNFLQDYLSDPSRIEAQWNLIKPYQNTTKHTSIAHQNKSKNRLCVPYDENLVPVEIGEEKPAYLNASFIYDDDPRQPVYMAGQSPASEEILIFWQAIWQHGVCLIVNLSTLEESRQEMLYWPDTGSQTFGNFEVQLISEHIWSDDYVVRSFHLKNLATKETRTVTQFQYVSWQKDSTPTSAKSLMEFRRKVNKSYRGRSSPVLVHSWDGVGRVGVYCSVDLLCARLLRGVREIDIVASVEHLRDQRDGMVRTGDQFKLIYGCVANEVSSLLKANTP